MYEDLFGHELEWQRQSRCRGMGTELFFPQDGESLHQRSRRERAAKQLCSTCPVAERCRSYAVSTSEPHGIWGGLSTRERRASIPHTYQRGARAPRPSRETDDSAIGHRGAPPNVTPPSRR
ncbi:MAG: WhiB family transcriptional regulator [Rhodococcus sp. (in: high G+C Gram-positive bacteria)]|nr:MAG: WhiB family transcriptional regulator [Rhodococcus sp. (in: high G+C Gram-positive bacteria)]